jgi:hypothetical protein
VAGNENFSSWDFKNSISFSDNIAELIDGPYVNYVLASADENAVKNIASKFENLDEVIEDNISEYLSKIGLGENVNAFLRENLGTVYYEMTKNEQDSLGEMFKLIYYHGILEDMFDVKFV